MSTKSKEFRLKTAPERHASTSINNWARVFKCSRNVSSSEAPYRDEGSCMSMALGHSSSASTGQWWDRGGRPSSSCRFWTTKSRQRLNFRRKIILGGGHDAAAGGFSLQELLRPRRRDLRERIRQHDDAGKLTTCLSERKALSGFGETSRSIMPCSIRMDRSP